MIGKQIEMHRFKHAYIHTYLSTYMHNMDVDIAADI